MKGLFQLIVSYISSVHVFWHCCSGPREAHSVIIGAGDKRILIISWHPGNKAIKRKGLGSKYELHGYTSNDLTSSNLLKTTPSSSCIVVLGSSLQHVGYKIQIVVYSYKKISFPPGTDLVSIAGPDARDVTGVMELMMIPIAFLRRSSVWVISPLFLS